MQAGLAAPGREVLSSRLTTTIQVVPMVMWAVETYVVIWLVLHHVIGLAGLSSNGVAPLLHRLVWLLLVLPLLVLPLIGIWAAGLRRVTTDGDNLQVSRGSGGDAEIPLTQVLLVSESAAADLRTIRVAFDRQTAVGRRIRFLAPTRFRVARGEPHPVVLALKETVEAAHSQAAPRTFGKRVGGV